MLIPTDEEGAPVLGTDAEDTISGASDEPNAAAIYEELLEDGELVDLGDEARSDAEQNEDGLEIDPEDADELPDDESAEPPQLDPLFAEALADHPELLEQVQERWGEIEELHGRLQEQVATVSRYEEMLPQIEVINAYAEAFDNPDTVGEAYAHLGRELERLHGFSLNSGGDVENIQTLLPLADGFDDLLPELDEQTGEARELYERAGFGSEGEFFLAQELLAAQQKNDSIEERLQQIERGLRPGAETYGESEARAEISEFIARELPSVRAKLNREYSGFGNKVNETTLLNALERFPNLWQDPAAAVRACYTNEITKFVSGVVARNNRPGPEAIPHAQGRGRRIKDAENYSAADAYSELYFQGS